MSVARSCLVVEDDPVMRTLLSDVLASRGHEVRSAEDGFSALALMRMQLPEILLSDLNMPGMSGFELLSVVRRLHPRVLVIATSGAYTGRGIPLGIAADAFHEKGTGLQTLLALLDFGNGDPASLARTGRMATPLWVDLESYSPLEPDHVLLQCAACLRPFRENIAIIHADIRATHCCFCGSRVEYALALAIRPPGGPARFPRAAPGLRVA